MAGLRPILDTFQRTLWVAATPVDATTVREIMPRQVQVAIRGAGPMASRELVPLTPAARELLHGSTRDRAQQVLRGMLAPLDAQRGESNLRGLSLSTDDAAFATNMLASNIEAGYEPDSVSAQDRAGFERSFGQVARSTRVAKAQNTGWMDLGPRVSAKVLDLIDHGPAAGRDVAAEVALTTAHELQHSFTPPKAPGVPEPMVWLEEGIAETMAWWPGTAARSMERMGVPARPGHEPDPFTAPPDSVASGEYRQRHISVLRLLGLAGVELPSDGGRSATEQARQAAHQLLQGEPVERVPRNLARAIAKRHGLRADEVPTLADLIVDTQGRPAEVDALSRAIGAREPRTELSGRDS